jgi:hypothetical protein
MEHVLERESGDGNVSSELGEVVLVGIADLLDDAVKPQTFE